MKRACIEHDHHPEEPLAIRAAHEGLSCRAKRLESQRTRQSRRTCAGLILDPAKTRCLDARFCENLTVRNDDFLRVPSGARTVVARPWRATARTSIA